MTQSDSYDVIIIGGSFAGLSAGLALGRSVRKVLILDGGEPCNRFTAHSHNFLTHDGQSPGEILRLAKNDLSRYNTVRMELDLAVSGKKISDQKSEGFEIKTKSGKIFQASKLIFATGVKDILPDLQGFADCWGKSIIHCPYCHGYEFKNQSTGILGNGGITFEFTKMIYNLTKDLRIFTNGESLFSAEEKSKLSNRNIEIFESEIKELKYHDGMLQLIELADNSKIPIDALYFRPDFEHKTNIPESLGCELGEMGYLKIDAFSKTSIDGVYACGDNTTMMRSVSNAVAMGNLAGAMANKDLAGEKF
ncbi:NAD(P)/FAD-dependent oxidoreductase [Leptospira sp. GIMC2001]|uniref:NAD(P)/FAD-dependent oxidoreductase n=1 Tax=Leptospira sp. GIMC2001 TaxID=1513297 RepID=UPI002348FF86|nr:NAD(P)/FAD-dependent oxidoreductase [Leptospira sp. GIMC2001]WCL49051.1 NAD(P)/FAD-dependent oxidoreductase [Leptospira sp. GIMC2001]